MILGTHNSATSSSLVWWLKPLAWVINPTSKCQDRTIAQQLADGVKVFNLQVAYIGGKWRFTHGLAVYNEDVFDTLRLMRLCASVKEPIYIQLYLDKCLWCKQAIRKFLDLVEQVNKEYCNTYFIMQRCWVEGSDIYPHRSNSGIDLSEHYWSKGWVRSAKPKCLLDRLPLPRYHARKYNKQYKENNNHKYLMLDYYNYG